MVSAFLLDKTYKIKDVIPVSDFSAKINLWNVAEFDATITGIKKYNFSDEDIISIFEDNTCVYSGTVKSVSYDDGKISGYDLRYVMMYLLASSVLNISPVEVNKFQANFKDAIRLFVSYAYPLSEIDFSFVGAFTSGTYKLDTRTKYVYEIVRELCIEENADLHIFAVGNNKIKCVVRKCFDRSGTICLLTGISATQIERVINKKNVFNQILGLGAGEKSNRDYVFIDNSTTDGIKRCYIYDLREDIDHESLVKKTRLKLKELTSDNYIKFQILPNNLHIYGSDYYLGDKVTFVADNGKQVKDIITEVEINIKSGTIIPNYSAAIGSGKNKLTQKIAELKEGGYK